MEFARITSPDVREALFVLVDEDISGVVREEAMAAEVAEIDRLIAEVDRELADEARMAVVRVSRSFNDLRRVRRAARRGERSALRALPSRWGVAELGGEVAA